MRCSVTRNCESILKGPPTCLAARLKRAPY
jgi:hypothetical protein